MNVQVNVSLHSGVLYGLETGLICLVFHTYAFLLVYEVQIFVVLFLARILSPSCAASRQRTLLGLLNSVIHPLEGAKN